MIALPFLLPALAAGLVFAHGLGFNHCSGRVVFCGAWGAAQAVFLQTLLGALGWLHRPELVLGSLVLNGVALVAGLFLLREEGRGGDAGGLSAGTEAFALFRHPDIVVLGFLALVGWIWAAAAAYFLPPRGADDLCFHLFPVFEAAVRGRFVLLPLEFRPWVALPLNADLLSLWPVILDGNIRWADGAQLVTGPWAAACVAGLARLMGASRRSAAMGGLLFLLIPVGLRQASSAYTDLTMAAFFGTAAFGTFRFFQLRDRGSLFLAGLGIGLLAGSHYGYLVAILPLVPFLIGRGKNGVPCRVRGGGWCLLFAIPVVLLGSYWYLRNGLALGNPFHPYSLGVGSLKVFHGPLSLPSPLGSGQSLVGELVRQPSLLTSWSLRDLGIGGIKGGLGPVFWGAVLPLGLWEIVSAIREGVVRRSLRPGINGFLFLAGLLPLLFVPVLDGQPPARVLLTAAVPGLAILALRVERLRDHCPAPAAVTLFAGVVAGGLPLLSMGGAQDPVERTQLVDYSEAAAGQGEGLSPWHFISTASAGVGFHAPGWELLDFLSAPPGEPLHPLWVFASGPFPSGLYGTFLQNRLWNLGGPGRPSLPDALFLYTPAPGSPGGDETFGEGRFIEDEVMARPDLWDMVATSPAFSLYLRSDLLRPHSEIRERLIDFYAKVHPDEIALAATLDHVPREGTIVALDPVGYGLKTLQLQGGVPLRVVLASRLDLAGSQAWLLDSGPVFLARGPGLEGMEVVGKMKRGGREAWVYAPRRKGP